MPGNSDYKGPPIDIPGNPPVTPGQPPVSPPGQSPVAKNDSFLVEENSTIIASLFSDNGFGADTDPNGDAFAITATDGQPISSGTPIAITSSSGRSSSITISEDGTLSFDPASSFDDLAVGEADTITFTYLIADSRGFESAIPATVTITVTGTNDAPTVESIISATAFEDDADFTIDLLDGASDVDNGETATLGVSNVSGLTDGVSLVGTTLLVDPAHAAFQHLGVGETQIIIVSYDVVDAHGASVPQFATITINGSNDSPTATAINSGIINEDDLPISINLLSTASDVDSSDDLDTANVVVTSSDGRSVVFSVDNEGGLFTVDPAQFGDLALGENLTLTISYNIIDGNGGLISNTATLVVEGDDDYGIAIDDHIVLTDGEDVYHGLAGNTLIEGLSGNDLIYGDTAQAKSYGWPVNFDFDDDIIFAGEGDDTIAGDAGKFLNEHNFYGSQVIRAGNDILDGGEGADTIYGDAISLINSRAWVYTGAQQLIFSGDDHLIGGAGNDTLYGDGANFGILGALPGKAKIYGGSDTLEGGIGDDILYGDAELAIITTRGSYKTYSMDIQMHGGDDLLIGGDGNDVIFGDFRTVSVSLFNGDGQNKTSFTFGNDIIIGGAGNDVLYGDYESKTGNFIFGPDGADTFVFAPSDGQDIIKDFDLGLDMIDLTAHNLTSFNELSILIIGGDTVIDFNNGDTITIENVTNLDEFSFQL